MAKKKGYKEKIPRPNPEKDLPPGRIRKAGVKARTYRERLEAVAKRTERPKRRRQSLINDTMSGDMSDIDARDPTKKGKNKNKSYKY